MTAMDVVLALVGLAVGLAFGWMRGRQLLAGAVSRGQYDTAVQERTALATRLESAQETLENVQRELTTYRERAVTAEAENKALLQRLKEQQEQLRLEFSKMTHDMLENLGKKFSTQSEKQIGDLLNPLRERLGEFQKLVTDKFGEQGKEQHTLKSEIEKIVLQTDSLTKALRGDVKAQGNWGEVMLERILEESGLRKGEDYVTQGAQMGLTGADGNRLQPDVIVKLPEGKHIIIDSKVSLTDYERFCAETDEQPAALHLRNFLKSVRNHVGGLEQKKYQDIAALGTPDFVLMFMPVEGAYSLAVQQDRELHSYAWGKKIVIVCPATLFATLRTIASLWNIERQNKHAQQIAAEAAKMYDKFVDFIDDMDAVGTRMTQMQASYDQAFNKLSKGRGNLVSKAEKLKQLGVKASKALPLELVDENDGEETPLLQAAEG